MLNINKVTTELLKYGHIKNLEVECRLTKRGTSYSEVNEFDYFKLLSHFSELYTPKEYNITDQYQGSFRLRNDTESIDKIVLSRIPIRDFNLFFSISEEKEVPRQDTYESIVTKRRTSFEIGDYIVDFDERTDDTRAFFIEIEFKKYNEDDVKKFLDMLLKIYLSTDILYTHKEFNTMIEKVNSFFGLDSKDNLRRIVPKPRDLKYKDMVYGGLVGSSKHVYVASPKADGLRRFLFISTDSIALLDFSSNLANLIVKNKTDIPIPLRNILIDGELTKNNIYLGFDIAYAESIKNITTMTYFDRVTTVKKIMTILRSILPNLKYKFYDKSIYSIVTVPQFYENMNKLFDSLKGLDFECDGIIFTPNNHPYLIKTRTVDFKDRILTNYPDICKWKPIEKLSIDFKIKIVDDVVELYVKGRDGLEKFSKTNVMDEMFKFHPNGIFEFIYLDGSFHPFRYRRDRLEPNTYTIATEVFRMISNPIYEKTLRGQDITLFKKYMNICKTNLINMIHTDSTILDVGSGRGGDLSKYYRIRPKQLILLEPNNENLTELKSRLEEMDSEFIKIVKIIHTPFELLTCNFTVDVISMMLSGEFFFKDRTIFNAMIKNVKSILKPNGKLVIFTEDGNAVKQLFRPILGSGPNSDVFNVFDGYIKYSDSGLLEINFPDTIVKDYQVGLFIPGDFIQSGFTMSYYMRSDKEKFLNPTEEVLSRLYSSFIFQLS